MKSYQFFKIFKRFYKKREKKTLIQQSTRKEKLRKVELSFIRGYFLKPFKLTVVIFCSIGLFVHNFFFISQARSQRNFCFLI